MLGHRLALSDLGDECSHEDIWLGQMWAGNLEERPLPRRSHEGQREECENRRTRRDRSLALKGR